MVALVGRLTGHPRPIIGLGNGLSYLQAFMLEVLPGGLMSRDNVRSMQVDNVTTQPFPLGIEPAALEATAATWLGSALRSRYSIYRDRPGRAS
jgi:NADH dehydrogenase